MSDTHDPNDVILSRINLQLARSQSILNSWLPQRQDGDDQRDGAIDNDEDFVTFGEKAGIEIKSAGEDDSTLPTRRSATKDKLLEQLIGKKAANAKRKEDAHKSMSAARHAAPKPVTNGTKDVKKRQEESEDEEEGRAAMLKSRKGNSRKVGEQPREDVPIAHDEDNVSGDVQARAVDGQDGGGDRSPMSSVVPAGKRKGGGSYLDELLAKKGNKKKKRQKL